MSRQKVIDLVDNVQGELIDLDRKVNDIINDLDDIKELIQRNWPNNTPQPPQPPTDAVTVTRPGNFLSLSDAFPFARITESLPTSRRFTEVDMKLKFRFNSWGQHDYSLMRVLFWLYLDDEWHETIGYAQFRGPHRNLAILAQTWGEDQRSTAPVRLQPGSVYNVHYGWVGGAFAAIRLSGQDDNTLFDIIQPAGHTVIEADRQIDLSFGVPREHNNAPWGGIDYFDLELVMR